MHFYLFLLLCWPRSFIIIISLIIFIYLCFAWPKYLEWLLNKWLSQTKQNDINTTLTSALIDLLLLKCNGLIAIQHLCFPGGRWTFSASNKWKSQLHNIKVLTLWKAISGSHRRLLSELSPKTRVLALIAESGRDYSGIWNIQGNFV